MEQKLRYGQVLDQLAVLKKNSGLIMSNLCGRFFHVFMGGKRNLIFYSNRLNVHNQFCLAPEDTFFKRLLCNDFALKGFYEFI